MKNYFMLILSCLAFRLSAQEVTFSCSYTGAGGLLTAHSFDNADLEENLSNVAKVVERILNLYPNTDKIQVQMSPEVNNASAAIRNGQRFILYSKYFIELAQSKYNGEWKLKGIFAHEIGHHIIGHTAAHHSSRPDLELEADKWAGSTLYKLGATLEQTVSCLYLVSEKGSLTHPPRVARKQAMEAGWNEAKAANLTPNPAPKPRIDPPTPRPAKSDFTELATGTSFVMKHIQGGTFQMGSKDTDIEAGKDEKPAHPVRMADFYMGKYEVTVGEYLKFCQTTNSNWPQWLEINNEHNIETGSNKYYFDKGYRRTGSERLPIAGVNWDNAVAYCKWVSNTTGKTYRLPTEAEWEYSARGGETYSYAGSYDLEETAWYSINSGSKPHPVGQKKANGYGLYDMSGNIYEWCADAYDSGSYSNPILANSMTGGVLRGGSWSNHSPYCRVAYRYYITTTYRSNFIGFRLVCLSQ